MIDLDTHEVKKKINYITDDDEWYEIKYLPFQKYEDFKTNWDIFNEILTNWGGVKNKGKEFECTEENKKLFFLNAGDRVQFVFDCSQNRTFFGPNAEDYLKRLGGFLATSKNGAKRSRNQTSQTAPVASKS